MSNRITYACDSWRDWLEHHQRNAFLSSGYKSCQKMDRLVQPVVSSVTTVWHERGIDDNRPHCYLLVFAIWLLYFLDVFRRRIFQICYNGTRQFSAIGTIVDESVQQRGHINAIEQHDLTSGNNGILPFPLDRYKPSSALVLCATTPSSDEHATSRCQIHASTLPCQNSRSTNENDSSRIASLISR